MRKPLALSIDVFLILLSVGGIFLSFLAIHHEFRVVRVVSNSMSPAIHRGDSLIFRSEPTSSIKQGQVLLLPLADGSGTSYVHRVVEKENQRDSTTIVVTKGDANQVPDNWKLKITSDRVPVYLATIPTKDIPILSLNKWLLLGIFSLAPLLLIPLLFPRKEKSKRLIEKADE